MFNRYFMLLSAVLAVLVGIVLATDIGEDRLAEELRMGWKMGLRPRQSSQNLQFFQGSLGGTAPGITQSNNPDRPFSVGGDTFPDFYSAAQRACDNQKNTCATAANSGASHDVGACDQQNNKCQSEIQTATKTTFDKDDNNKAQPENALVSSDANFDYFCDL